MTSQDAPQRATSGGMTHPLLRVVCCYGAGVAAGMWLGLTVLPGLVMFSVLLLAFVLWRRGRTVLFPLISASVGVLNLSLREAVLLPNDIRLVAPAEPVLASVRGRLVAPVRLIAFERDGENQFRSMAELQVTSLLFEGEWRLAHGRIALNAPGMADGKLHVGRTLEATGVLTRPEGPKAEGLFDYRRYLALRGIHHQLFTESTDEWKGVDESTGRAPLPERFIRWARTTLARGLPADDPATGLIPAMTLGWKTALTDEVERPFMKSGTMHIFAISGLHVAFMAGILLTVLRLVRLPRTLCGLVAIPALWFYAAATGWQSSAVRATIMMSIILGGWALRRPSNLVNSLAAAALVILLVEPRQLFQASFQLSFAVVLSLALILPPLQEGLLQRLRPDPLLPLDLVPRWKRWLGEPLRWVALSAAISLAAWLGSMPLTAAYFHLFSPGTLLANLLLVPCAAATLASAVASLACGAWWPWMSETFNHGAWAWMHAMISISESVAKLPGAYRYVPAPSAALLAVYYGTMLGVAFGWWKGRGMRRWVAGGGLLCLGLLAVQSYQRWHAAEMTVLPLHGGMGVYVKPAGTARPTLIDCGNTNAFRSLLLPFLEAHGVNRLQALFLTHGDARHMAAAPLLLESRSVEALVVSHVPFRSSVYRELLQSDLPRGTVLRRVAPNEQLHHFEMRHPPADQKAARADEAVMVLRLELPACTILLLSDLNRDGQRRLLDGTPAERLQADVVVVGLPDTGEPLIPELLSAIQPQLVIVGDDARPPQRRASPELLERLESAVPMVLSTRQSGAIKISARGGRWMATGREGEVLAASER